MILPSISGVRVEHIGVFISACKLQFIMSKLEDSTTEKRLKLSATLSHHYFVKVLDKNEETKANAVLFIMNTSISQKVMLSIFPVDRESFDTSREGIQSPN